MSQAGFEFDVVSAAVDESAALAGASPSGAALALAAAKARAVAARRPDSAVLGADTVVALDGQLLGKPASPAEALGMLARLRGREHDVVTGVAVVWQGRLWSGAGLTRVTIRPFLDREAHEYVSGGSPLDKAGGYGIQDRPFAPVERYDGCYLNVVGLPLCVAGRLLREAGVLSGAGPLPACPGHSGPARELAR
jgi:MAF protein